MKHESNPIGMIYGKTTPSTVQAIQLVGAPNIGVGRLVRIPIPSFDSKDEINLLGRIASVWTQNRLLAHEDMMPKMTTKDLKEGITLENLGLAKEIAGWVGFSIIIIGIHKDGAFVRPRSPLSPGQIIHLADDNFVSSFFRKDQIINIGHLRDNYNVPAYLDYERLVTHHFSVLAMTGAGKSYTVGVILEELFLVDDLQLPILLIDPHSEYSSTSIPNKLSKQNLELAENIGNSIITFIPGSINNTVERRFEKRFKSRRVARAIKFHPAELETWQIKTLLKQYYGISEAQSAALDQGWDEIYMDAISGLPPTSIEELISKVIVRMGEKAHVGTKRALTNKLTALLKREYFTFDIKQSADVSNLIQRGQISILDLGGIEAFDQQALVGLLLRKLFELRKSGGTDKVKPFLTLIEEAHNFIPPGATASASKQIIARLAAEGRKFGVGLGIVSQRPSKVDSDILSQCNTHIVLRLMNPSDQHYIKSISEFMTEEDFEAIRGLATGECMIMGMAVPFTLLVNIKERRMTHGGFTPSLREELLL